MRFSDNGTVDIGVDVCAKTSKAILVSDGDKEDAVWVPISQISFPDISDIGEGEFCEIEIPEWLASDKGLI